MAARDTSVCRATVLFPGVSLVCVVECVQLVAVLRLKRGAPWGPWVAGMAKAQVSFSVPYRGFLWFPSLIY